MARPLPGTFRLTPALAAAHAGGPVVCLADASYGQTFRLHASRPRYDRSRDLRRADGYDAAPVGDGVVVPDAAPLLARVEIRGPLEQRAGYHDECGGHSDGYDAIAERLCAALDDADVLLTIDSPGGAVCGLFECVDLVLAHKAATGRKITVQIDGMAASAGYCIAACLADPGELYVTRGGMAGSIGARSAHVSEEGALAQAGLVWTDFAYPAGKVALSPARALSETGKARGERDVMDAFNAFQAAVTAARPALTRKAIVALDADMLTGGAALAAGLVDGVAPIADVEAWALSRAGESNMNVAAEGETPPPEKPGAAEPPPADEEPMACAKCEEEMPTGAKFCAQCGAKVKAEGEEEPDGDEEPVSSKPAARIATGSTVASMLGLRPGASDVAVKTALSSLVAFRDHVLGALGCSDMGSARGALKATLQDARKGVKAAVDLKTEREAAARRERLDIFATLAKAGLPDPDLTPGQLLIQTATEAGRPLAPRINAAHPLAFMPLADLRAYAKTKLVNAGPERSPYEPSEDAAKEAAKPGADPALRNDPAVLAAAKSGIPIDIAAEIHARRFPAQVNP